MLNRMTTLQIRDVPEEVKRDTQGAGGEEGQSLSEYALAELTPESPNVPRFEELTERIRRRGGPRED